MISKLGKTGTRRRHIRGYLRNSLDGFFRRTVREDSKGTPSSDCHTKPRDDDRVEDQPSSGQLRCRDEM